MRIACGAVLFDLDGVLVDSTPAVLRVWARWAEKHELDFEQTARLGHGRPNIDTIRELLPHADHEAESREVERLEIEDVADVIPLPGALQLLRTLPLERWAIVTSCTRPLAEVRIRAAGLPQPKHLVTSNDSARGKPAPDPYAKGAELLNFAPKDCVVIEDAPAGIRSGKAAGARVLALLTTMQYELLATAGADWIASDCAAISVERSASDAPIVLKL
jgi:sugar-phosphatase